MVVGTARIASRAGRAYISSTCQITGAIVIGTAGSADGCPACPVAANQRAGTVVIGAAHAPGGTGAGLTAYQTARCSGTYQGIGTIAIGSTCSAGGYPALAVPAYQGTVAVVVVTANATGQSIAGIAAYLGTACAGANQISSALGIGAARTAGCNTALTITAAHQGVGAPIVVGTCIADAACAAGTESGVTHQRVGAVVVGTA